MCPRPLTPGLPAWMSPRRPGLNYIPLEVLKQVKLILALLKRNARSATSQPLRCPSKLRWKRRFSRGLRLSESTSSSRRSRSYLTGQKSTEGSGMKRRRTLRRKSRLSALSITCSQKWPCLRRSTLT